MQYMTQHTPAYYIPFTNRSEAPFTFLFLLLYICVHEICHAYTYVSYVLKAIY